MRLTRLEMADDHVTVLAEFVLEDGGRNGAAFSISHNEDIPVANPTPASVFDGSPLDATQVRQIINAACQYHRAYRGLGN